ALRVAPFVGRAAERSRLWAALREADRGTAQAIGLDGPPGVGRTRLAEWLAERARELGVAHALIVRDGLARAIAADLGVAHLAGDALADRVRDEIPDRDEARALARWIGGDERDPGRGRRPARR